MSASIVLISKPFNLELKSSVVIPHLPAQKYFLFFSHMDPLRVSPLILENATNSFMSPSLHPCCPSAWNVLLLVNFCFSVTQLGTNPSTELSQVLHLLASIVPSGNLLHDRNRLLTGWFLCRAEILEGRHCLAVRRRSVCVG